MSLPYTLSWEDQDQIGPWQSWLGPPFDLTVDSQLEQRLPWLHREIRTAKALIAPGASNAFHLASGSDEDHARSRTARNLPMRVN
jgi:hypothetical protein